MHRTLSQDLLGARPKQEPEAEIFQAREDASGTSTFFRGKICRDTLKVSDNAGLQKEGLLSRPHIYIYIDIYVSTYIYTYVYVYAYYIYIYVSAHTLALHMHIDRGLVQDEPKIALPCVLALLFGRLL